MTLDKPKGNLRWRIVALLFFATTINYVDRNTLSFIILDDNFKRDMLDLLPGTILTDDHIKAFKVKMSEVDAIFKFAYAIGFLVMGWLIDKVGVKLGYTVSIFVWAVSAISHGIVGKLGIGSFQAQLAGARLGLGIGEGGNFPSAVKAVAQWFPKRERSFASGVFNAGANIGIIATAAAVPVLLHNFGWRGAFLCTASMGFILLILWQLVYTRPEESKKLSIEELDYIKSDNDISDAGRFSWAALMGKRQLYGVVSGKVFTDCVWYFYLFWIPTFMNERGFFDGGKGEKVMGFVLPIFVMYVVSDFGSVAFGWLSTRLIQNGWSINAARKTTLLACALCVAPVYFVSQTGNQYVALALLSLAAAAHQGWSATIYTINGDMFPRLAVGSVAGISGTAGALGSIALSYYSGTLINNYGYWPIFLIASCAYLFALLVIQLIVPKLQPATIEPGDIIAA